MQEVSIEIEIIIHFKVVEWEASLHEKEAPLHVWPIENPKKILATVGGSY